MPTLSQHVCFTCRKVFKKPHEYAREVRQGKTIPYTIRKCPQCGGNMRAMGYKFRAPRTENTKEWGRIESALREGRNYAIPTIRKPGRVAYSS